MKRFYCTICNKVKRVQKYPTILENEIADNPINRIGECNHHSNPHTHTPKIKPTKVESPVTVSVSHRGRR